MKFLFVTMVFVIVSLINCHGQNTEVAYKAAFEEVMCSKVNREIAMKPKVFWLQHETSVYDILVLECDSVRLIQDVRELNKQKLPVKDILLTTFSNTEGDLKEGVWALNFYGIKKRILRKPLLIKKGRARVQLEFIDGNMSEPSSLLLGWEE